MNNKNVTPYIAKKIKEFREKRGFTQQEVADYLKTTQQSIARYESGERKTDNNVLFSLADYFHISINDFFPPLEIDQQKLEEFINECNDDLQKKYQLLYSKIKDLDEDKQKIIFNVTESIIKEIDEQLDGKQE